MEEGKILLVGNETDILHCGYSFPLSEDGKRYPSADHYAHSMILTQLKLDEVHILELLATPSANVSLRARELLQENMPAGHDMNSLAQYLMTSRQSYTMLGLRLRAEQDKRFKQALIETKDALLLVCDRRDLELGIGMNDVEFVAFARKHRADAERIGQWMHDERTRPRELGQNQLGFFLMWLRYEIREKERAKWTCTQEVIAKGLSIGEDDQNIDISISDFVISLQGIFRPLSNYYAMNFEIKGDVFRSVEHYAYQRLFESLKLDYEELMKLRTTVLPVDVAKVAKRVLKTLQIDEKDIESKSGRLERWRQSAMKHKISKNEYLQKLLLSTGHAILIDNLEEGDSQWFSKTDEFELQHLLSKKYMSPTSIIDYMCGGRGGTKIPYAFYHLNGNKSGMLLMELRAKFAVGCTHRIPLVSPLVTNVLRTAVSPHMICFTPESVLHPFYPISVRPIPDADPLPSAAHLVAMNAFKFFGIQKDYQDYIMETELGSECWHRLHYVLNECLMPSIEKIQQWYMEERQNTIKIALQMSFEQNQFLQRILLETEDALLVSCARFSSLEGELNIGMREQDLRLWLTQVDIDTKNLIDLCLRPMAFRPSYLGGNRLGLILMELRRDFILQGVFPKQLSPNSFSVETILGTDSPTENYLPHYAFDPLDLGNYNALWANPFLLMAKQMTDTNPDLWQKATSVKRPPILLSTNSQLIEEKLELIKEMHKNQRNETITLIEDLSPPVLRSFLRDLLMLIREKTITDCAVQLQISNKSKESNRMQEIRRSAERTRDRIMNNDSSSIQQQQQQHWSQPPLGRPTKPVSPNHYRNGRGNSNPISQLDLKMPSLIPEFSTPSTSQNNNNLNNTNSNSLPSLRDRYDHRDRRLGGSNRGYDGGRRPMYSTGQRRPRSPSPNNNGGGFYNNRRSRSNIQSGISPYRGSSAGRSPSQDTLDNNGSKYQPTRTPSIIEQQSAAKKSKKIVDESELSEGEILSDDDE